MSSIYARGKSILTKNIGVRLKVIF